MIEDQRTVCGEDSPGVQCVEQHQACSVGHPERRKDGHCFDDEGPIEIGGPDPGMDQDVFWYRSWCKPELHGRVAGSLIQCADCHTK